MYWSIALIVLVFGLSFASSFYGWPANKLVNSEEIRLSRAASNTFFVTALASSVWISEYVTIGGLAHGWVRTIVMVVIAFVAALLKKLVDGVFVLAVN